MKIAVAGTGYVGLVTGACLAKLGHKVVCVDIDKTKIDQLNQGIVPIYEPGLDGLLEKDRKKGNLRFTTNLAQAIKDSLVIFIAVGTPTGEDSRADLQYVRQVAEEIGRNIGDYKVVVNKSTVPVGTADFVSSIIRSHYQGDFDVVSNPEFLREGSAIKDFMEPDRIVIGCSTEKSEKIMREIYQTLEDKIMITDPRSSEMIKYASNAFLACSISFINSIANICEGVDADVGEVAKGMRADKRIGPHAFLDAGVGYGGSCFPKDVKALIKTAEESGYDFKLLKMAEKVNREQRELLVSKIKSVVPQLKGANIGVLGLAFKPETDDMREAPSVTIIRELQALGARIKAYDPVAEPTAKCILEGVEYCRDPYEVAQGSDILVFLTEWKEFRQLNLARVKEMLKKPNIVDGRNIFDPSEMEALGFNYVSIGR